MSNIPSLEALHNNRDALLLAEVAAWLHDMGKCADEHIINQASDKPQGYAYSYKTAQSHRLPSGLPDVCLMNETISVKDLIEQGMPRVISDASKPWLLRSLGRCHSAAHVEKELSERETSTKQPKDNTRLSTAFGFEGNPVTGLTNALSRLPFNSMQNRARFIPQVEMTFDTALGDTRRPINEVTLADWSGAVAALYKSASAGVLLGNKPSNPDDLQWRLLRVNFDVLGLYAKAVKIGDLLAYQRAVEQACEAVKKLVEEEYPLGNEIYRDSTGIYFTFPDLDLPADLAQEIRRRVEAVEMELTPRIKVTAGDGNTASEQLKSILGKARREALAALEHPFDSQNLSHCWQQQWETVEQGRWEVCPVCGLRPKREDREVCETCEKRRGSRLKDWLKNLQYTIWLDEVADLNGRLALVVGKFGLEDWLSGDLVQTMLVKFEPKNPAACMPKNPSPARLRRIWETTQRFWETALEGKKLIPEMPHRIILYPDDDKYSLETSRTYELVVQDRRLSVVWDKENTRFITCDNLGYFEKLIGKPLSQALKPGSSIDLYTPAGYGERSRKMASITLKRIEQDDTPYSPAIPILTDPQIFLTLVPAEKALDVAEAIREKYQREMGKVQNRLPLFLGLVFFQRRTPLMAVMATARRMLASEFTNDKWRIAKCEDRHEKRNDQDVLIERMLVFENQCEMKVKTVMGDNETPDLWYPYFFVTGEQPHHGCRFQLHKAEDNDSHKGSLVSEQFADRWLVHVNELKQDDEVQITPSRFAYLFLESAAQRFRFDPHKDMMLLDELSRLKEMWQRLKASGITNSSLRGVQALLESKGAAWEKPGDEMKHLVETTLKQADLLKVVTVDDVLSGRFAQCLELHLHILKLKLKEA